MTAAAAAAAQWRVLEGSLGGNKVTLRLLNLTVLNEKAFAYLAEVAQEEALPMILALNECHLRGLDLNKVRRQIKVLGWRCFVTPACDKHWGPHPSECRLALGAGTLASDLEHAKSFVTLEEKCYYATLCW